MKKIISAIFLVIAANSIQAIELATYPKVFSGAEGIEVVLAPSVDGKEALIRISGVNHPVDNVVFLTKAQKWNGSTEAFVTTIDGRDSGMVQKRKEAYGNGERYLAYLPGRQKEFDLSFDEKKSKALKPSELLSTYERQTKQGVQQKLAQFDRQKHVTASTQRLLDTDKDATQSCGTPIKTTVDWKSIDDDKLKKLSIDGFCGAVAAGMGRLCSDDTSKFKPKAAALGDIQCQFGSELKARMVDRKLVFTTQENAANQDDFIREFLRNQ